MSFFQELGANQVLVSASLGWLIAQILKTLIDPFNLPLDLSLQL